MADDFEIRQRMVARIASLTEGVRVLTEALEKQARAWSNVQELGLLPEQHRMSAKFLEDNAHAALTTAKELTK